MKLTKPKLKHYIIILILILIGYISFETTGITVSDKSWKCHYTGGKCICEVHYTLRNNSRNASDFNISLRGIRYEPKGKGSKSLLVVGDKQTDIKVYPDNPAKIVETLECKQKPTDIKINVWEKNN